MSATTTPSKQSKKSMSLKKRLIITVVALLVCYAGYYALLRTTNEIGWLGADKYGRQVLVQTLNDYTESDGLKIESDFTDHPVWQRMLIGEPMRTTMKYEVQKATNKPDLKAHLAQPYQSFTDHYTGTVTIRENQAIPRQDIIKRLEEHKAKTLEDFYAGFGFRRIELFVQGKLVSSVDLKGTQNTK